MLSALLSALALLLQTHAAHRPTRTTTSPVLGGMMSWALSVPLLLQRLALAAAVAAHVAGSRQHIVACAVASSLPPRVLS